MTLRVTEAKEKKLSKSNLHTIIYLIIITFQRSAFRVGPK